MFALSSTSFPLGKEKQIEHYEEKEIDNTDIYLYFDRDTLVIGEIKVVELE